MGLNNKEVKWQVFKHEMVNKTTVLHEILNTFPIQKMHEHEKVFSKKEKKKTLKHSISYFCKFSTIYSQHEPVDRDALLTCG